MANYKKQTGISFIIAEKEDGTYDVNMGSNADLPQDGLPVKIYTGKNILLMKYFASLFTNN